MMTPTRDITLSTAVLAALVHMIPNPPNAERDYLNALHIEPHPQGGVLAVATDGHILGAVHDPAGQTNGKWCCPVPEEMAAQWRKWATPPESAPTVSFVSDFIMCGATMLTVPAIADPGLEYRKKMPGWLAAACSAKGQEMWFQPAFMARCLRFAHALYGAEETGPRSFVLQAAGNTNPAVLRMDTGAYKAFVVFMPLDAGDESIPTVGEVMG